MKNNIGKRNNSYKPIYNLHLILFFLFLLSSKYLQSNSVLLCRIKYLNSFWAEVKVSSCSQQGLRVKGVELQLSSLQRWAHSFHRVKFRYSCICLYKGTPVGATNTASVISTAPISTSSPCLSPSSMTTSTDSKAGIHAQTVVTQTPTSVATSLGTGQVMVASPGLSAALQSAAQLPSSASFAAMAAAAGLSPGLMTSSQFAPGSVCGTFKQDLCVVLSVVQASSVFI